GGFGPGIPATPIRKMPHPSRLPPSSGSPPPFGTLVSCLRGSQSEPSDAGEDVIRGLDPDERLRCQCSSCGATPAEDLRPLPSGAPKIVAVLRGVSLLHLLKRSQKQLLVLSDSRALSGHGLALKSLPSARS